MKLHSIECLTKLVLDQKGKLKALPTWNRYQEILKDRQRIKLELKSAKKEIELLTLQICEQKQVINRLNESIRNAFRRRQSTDT